MLKLMSFLGMALIVDIIFLGPLGLNIYGLSIRKAIMAAMIMSSAFPLLSQRSTPPWILTFFIGSLLFVLMWGGIVPLKNDVDLSMSLAETQPVAALLLVLPFYYVIKNNGLEPYLKLIQYSVFIMAVIVIVVWAASNPLHIVSVGFAMRSFYYAMNSSEIGIYIGPMPDGTFRVMLINFILFPLMLCYYNWNKPNLPWSAFYSVAIFATGTRAFLLVGAMIVGFSLLRRRPLLLAPLVVTCAVVAVAYMADLEKLRVFELGSELTTSSARFVQYFALMSLFWQHPIFGAGLGAHAILIRSVEAPYSYELTYVAMLAKLGIVGSAVAATTVLAWTGRLMRTTGNWTSVFSLFAAVILMTATNPYLINLVGMSIVAFIVAAGAQVADLRVLRLSVVRHGDRDACA